MHDGADVGQVALRDAEVEDRTVCCTPSGLRPSSQQTAPKDDLSEKKIFSMFRLVL